MKKLALAMVGAVILVGLSAVTFLGKDEERQAIINPYISWSGAHSKVAETKYFKITDSKEWEKLWHRHAGEKSDVPAVNFEVCMVIAIFHGRHFNSAGIVITITEEGGQIRFRFDDDSYQTLGDDEKGGAVEVEDYGIFVIPRSTKPLVLEEDVQRLLDKPPIWKERARFEGETREQKAEQGGITEEKAKEISLKAVDGVTFVTHIQKSADGKEWLVGVAENKSLSELFGEKAKITIDAVSGKVLKVDINKFRE